jgi:hypothetical protein
MKVSVEFLLTHTSDEYEVGRVPCIGERVEWRDNTFEVKDVIHILDARTVVAIVRVK